MCPRHLRRLSGQTAFHHLAIIRSSQDALCLCKSLQRESLQENLYRWFCIGFNLFDFAFNFPFHIFDFTCLISYLTQEFSEFSERCSINLILAAQPAEGNAAPLNSLLILICQSWNRNPLSPSAFLVWLAARSSGEEWACSFLFKSADTQPLVECVSNASGLVLFLYT